MFSIQVQNLRSLKDTGEIQLAPMTLLVGENSSGKSSYLRIFPLLRQSVETVTGSGLLLRGGYVDYGPFPVALRKATDADSINLTLGFTVASSLENPFGSNMVIRDLPVKLRVSFAARSHEPTFSYLREVTLLLGNSFQDKIEIHATEEGRLLKLTINNYNVTKELDRISLRVGRGIVPQLRFLQTEAETTIMLDNEYDQVTFAERLLILTNDIFHGRTRKEVRLAVLNSIRLGSPEEMLSEFQSASSMEKWRSSVSRWTTASQDFQKVRDAIIANRLPTLLVLLARRLASVCSGVGYIAPLRSQVSRDYPVSDVAVEQVSKDGNNLPMILARLPRRELQEFQDWTREYFGFAIKVHLLGDGSTVSLTLQEAGAGMEVTLADTGFGFSQMLPFVFQIWNVTKEEKEYARKTATHPPRLRNIRRKRGEVSYIMALEQPELHLHPSLQAKVVDMMVSTIRVLKESNIPVHFLLETHSPTIVERVGHLINAGRLEPNDAKVLFFTKELRDGGFVVSDVKTAYYDKDGVLLDPFPLGFFLASSEGIQFSPSEEPEQAKPAVEH